MYNVHPYFSLKNLGKMCALYTAKYGSFVFLLIESTSVGLSAKFAQVILFLTLAKGNVPSVFRNVQNNIVYNNKNEKFSCLSMD